MEKTISFNAGIEAAKLGNHINNSYPFKRDEFVAGYKSIKPDSKSTLDECKTSEDDRILNKYNGLTTRPLSLGDLEIMFLRYQIMLKDEPERYTIIEFIEQEDFRRDLFKNKTK